MVYFHSSISFCKSLDQYIMLVSTSLNEPAAKSKQGINVSKKMPNYSKVPACNRSRLPLVDFVILIAVIYACGFLLFPYVVKVIEIVGTNMCILMEEVSHAPLIYGSFGLGVCCAALAAWGVLACTSRKCGNPNCKGLSKAAEFDIRLETEECIKNSSSLMKDGVMKGIFELPRDHHRELDAELKKMAPPNGRSVLVFLATCGCSVGRLEVPGPKKQQRKIKKYCL